MNRRKFLQMLVVGVVALAAKITGGLGAGPVQPESQGGYVVPEEYIDKLIGTIKGRKIYSTSVTYDNVETMLEKVHLAGKPCLIQFTQTPEDPDSWVHLEGADDWEFTNGHEFTLCSGEKIWTQVPTVIHYDEN